MLPEGEECADLDSEEWYEYMYAKGIMFMTIENFIDYKNFDGIPVSRIAKTIQTIPIESPWKHFTKEVLVKET